MTSLTIIAYALALLAGAAYELIADRREHISQQEVHRMRKGFFLAAFLFAVVLALAVPLAAQDGSMFDPGTVELILLGAGGLTVVGLTQMVKTWLKASGALAYIISAAVSGAATAYFLIRAGGFTWPAFLGYTAFVFLAANGIYKAKTA